MIGGGQKSAIGLTSMDSANISGVVFHNITIHGKAIATPLFLKLGNRAEGEDGKGHWPVGSITDVNFSSITATEWGEGRASSGRRSSYTPTIEGLSAVHAVGPVRVDGFAVVAPGGGSGKDASVDPPLEPDKCDDFDIVLNHRFWGPFSNDARHPPLPPFARRVTCSAVCPCFSDADLLLSIRIDRCFSTFSNAESSRYQPRYNGVRPSWGWFVRHAHDVVFTNCSLALSAAAHPSPDNSRGLWHRGAVGETQLGCHCRHKRKARTMV